MQTLVWCTGLLVSILFAQTINEPGPYHSVIVRTDSTVKITSKPSDDIESDVLQENLYIQIMSEINNPHFSTDNEPAQNKYQLLENCQRYYSKAKLRSDTLVIPYPPQKLDRFKDIKYVIPKDYFKNKNTAYLQPQIQLTLNQEKSTVMINKAYLLSYYRSPVIPGNSSQQYRSILQYIYNLLLPYTNVSAVLERYNKKSIVRYKGYKEHVIKLDSGAKFLAFWESLCAQGSLYYFPSKIDDFESTIHIYGLLYVMKDDILHAYHFGELKVTILKQQLAEKYTLELDFYPFVVNKQIGK